MPLGNSFPNSTFTYSLGDEVVTGNTFFVDSGHENAASDTDGLRNAPFSSIENALTSSNIAAGNGDRIIAMPGHTETLTADGGIALDKSGVDVIGVGRGTLRPVIILDAAAAAITVSADNCSIRNMEFRASIANVMNAIDITSKWFWADKLEFTEEGTNLNFIDHMVCSSVVNGTSDGLAITHCVGTALGAGQNSMLMASADIDRLFFADNWYSSANSATEAMIEGGSATFSDILMLRNYVYSGSLTVAGGLINASGGDNTGIVAHNRIGHHDTAGEVLVALTGVRQFDNLSTATDTASGYILPPIDS